MLGAASANHGSKSRVLLSSLVSSKSKYRPIQVMSKHCRCHTISYVISRDIASKSANRKCIRIFAKTHSWDSASLAAKHAFILLHQLSRPKIVQQYTTFLSSSNKLLRVTNRHLYVLYLKYLLIQLLNSVGHDSFIVFCLQTIEIINLNARLCANC